jgi:hypothetical protein
LLCAPLPVLCLCPVFLLLFVAGCKTPQHRAVEFDVFSFTWIVYYQNRQEIATFLRRLMKYHSVDHLMQWCQ